MQSEDYTLIEIYNGREFLFRNQITGNIMNIIASQESEAWERLHAVTKYNSIKSLMKNASIMIDLIYLK